jgi:tetratricopeptide (TPR) repeat protein
MSEERNRMRPHLLVASVALLIPGLAAAQHHHEPAKGEPPAALADLGDIEFPTSGSAEAQPHFLRGLLLLHSFEYRPALDAFGEARRIDPGFAMAYWGEAMALNHPIWGEQDTAGAREVLARLGATPAERQAKAPTEREKGYMAALEALYGDGDKASRDAAYSDAMGRLAARFPGDLDARAFYALSLLGRTGVSRDTATYMRAAAEAEEVYQANRRHPGALHYLIHAYDDPVHAPLGLRAARLYASVAPAASHAQHMPSHIFFALGLWDEAIATNIASMETARRQGSGGYHPLHWLQHAYLQVGRPEDAARLVAVVEEDVRRQPSRYARTHLAAARATWLVETNGAALDAMGKEVDSSGIVSVGPFASLDFSRGLASVETGDPAGARASLERLQARLAAARAVPVSAGDMASRYDGLYPSELAQVEIMESMLKAAIASSAGRHGEAISLARTAAVAEDAVEFEYGPPATVKPPYELLGEILLEAGRPTEAAEAFERVLKRYPNRRLTLEGLRKAGASAAATR